MRPTISVHAIRRFAERVMGVQGLPENDEAALVALRTLHGVSTLEIEKVLAATVSLGVAAGASGVRLDGMRYLLRSGVLVSVVPVRPNGRYPRQIARSAD